MGSQLLIIKGLYGNTRQGDDYLSCSQYQKDEQEKKARFSTTDITNHYLRKCLKKFNNSPDLVYKSKQVHNEPTDAYFFLIKHISKRIKIKRHIQQHIKEVKLGVNKKIGHVKEKFNLSNWKE